MADQGLLTEIPQNEEPAEEPYALSETAEQNVAVFAAFWGAENAGIKAVEEALAGIVKEELEHAYGEERVPAIMEAHPCVKETIALSARQIENPEYNPPEDPITSELAEILLQEIVGYLDGQPDPTREPEPV